jgi:putative aldouronate transport system substrate-binding protein
MPIYVPGKPDVTTLMHDSEVRAMKSSLPLPTVGLTSETEMAKGASLNKAISNAYTDVVLGRKSLSDWDGAVKTWQSGGGSKIAEEYEKAYAESDLS